MRYFELRYRNSVSCTFTTFDDIEYLDSFHVIRFTASCGGIRALDPACTRRIPDVYAAGGANPSSFSSHYPLRAILVMKNVGLPSDTTR